jgi:hypothetical protein
MPCRTACDCRNPTTWTPCTDEVPCYVGCAESPCAYAILSQCEWINGALSAYLHKITILWRDCLFNGIWSARAYCGGMAAGNAAELFDADGGTLSRPQDFGCAQHDYDCAKCGWTPEELAHSGAVWSLEVGGAPPGGYPDLPSGATAYLVFSEVTCDGGGNPVETQIAAYIATEEWSCLGRNTMTKHHAGTTNPPHVLFKYLPKKLCIVPYASNWEHPCGVGNPDICDCEDHGCPRFGLDITIECATPLSQTVIMSRVQGACDLPTSTVPGSDICDEITWPDVDCGVFYGFLDNTCDIADTQNFWFIAWCESGVWTLRTYCALIDDSVSPAVLESVTLIDTQVMTRINVCEEVFVEDGSIGDYLDEMFEPVVIEPSPDNEGCCTPCEPPIETDCCPDDPTPATLTDTITGCISDTITMTYNAGASPPGWEGTFTAGDCVMQVLLQCVTGTWQVITRKLSGSCTAGLCEANDFALDVTCNPFLAEAVLSPNASCEWCPTGTVTHTFTG